MRNKFSEYYKAVDSIENNLRADLIGPVSENEVLVRDMPLDYYVCGVLWPKRSGQILISDAEDLEDETSSVDDSITASNIYKPSAMGLTVMLKSSTKMLTGAFTYGKYSHREVEKEIPVKEENGETGTKNILIPEFSRTQISELFKISIGNNIGISHKQSFNNFDVQCNIRKILFNGDKLVTVSIVNSAVSRQKSIELNTSSLFQCNLELKTIDDNFIPLYKEGSDYFDEEDLVNNMLYSNVYNYAYGHGCSVDYNDTENFVNSIRSSFIPSTEVLQMMPNSLKNEKLLKMSLYKDVSKEEMISSMHSFIDEYKDWYETQKNIGDKMGEHINAVNLSLEKIEICIQRMTTGIELLSDEITYRAFVMMNEAMCLQRVKSKKGVKTSEVMWYPFQLAYVLQIIPDIINPSSSYRESVDLLWFPTGGGKTEAYLGVSAFTIFHRRLTNNLQDDGVTILMRYTLRLLTIQQFERATSLICACEFMRRKYSLSGGEINIGLWIGSNMTPNYLKKTREIINKLRENKYEKIYEGNPVQITSCPWCKAEIDFLFILLMKMFIMLDLH